LTPEQRAAEPANQRFVHQMAGGLLKQFGRHHRIEFEELVADGMIGLLEAARSYDDRRGVSFRTYAAHRITGAMKDGLRDRDELSRDHRATVIRAREELLQHTQACHLCRRQRACAARRELLDLLAGDPVLVSLDEPLLRHKPHQSDLRIDSVADEAPLPEDRAEAAERFRQLASSINRLPERERLVLVLFYFESMTLRAIGEYLGVTESRVSQIHHKALSRMRCHVHLQAVA
jgi:RNA polymerase sigma factor for flagellar operon FliA